MFEETTIIGRLTADPEMRFTPEGTPVTNFTVATEQYSGGDNCPKGWKQAYSGKGWVVTKFWRIAAWGKLAETCNQYLGKGRVVFVKGVVSGEAQDGTENPRIWEDRNGNARASFEMTARMVKFLGGRESASAEEETAEPGGLPPGWA